MKIEDIIALSNAGFTKNDIMAMCGQNQNQQMQNSYYAYSGYPQNMNNQSQQISENNNVLSALRNLTRSVQSNNVNMMQNQMPKQVTTEDAIASIINPPNYEGLTDGGVK